MQRLENFLLYTLLLAFATSFFSITLYEGFLALAILSGLILLIRKRVNPFKGIFSIPLTGHLSVITLSSVLFLRVKEQWRRLLEQDFFSLSYFATFGLDRNYLIRLVEWFIKLSPILGLVLSIKVLYTYYWEGDIKGFWGGNFVIGNLLALPTFAAVYLYLNTENKILKILLPAFGGLFLFTAFLPTERSVILGFAVGLAVLIAGLKKASNLRKAFPPLLVLFLAGSLSLIQSPKIQYWAKTLTEHHSLEHAVDTISSKRLTIAKGAWELVEDAYRNGDYLKLLIGWGYGPQKQYGNLPENLSFLNEYESFVFLTEFINGGLLNVLFLLWFYGALIYLTLKVLRDRNNLFEVKLVLISSVWVNMVYHLFTLFWVPINGMFYVLLALVERLDRTK